MVLWCYIKCFLLTAVECVIWQGLHNSYKVLNVSVCATEVGNSGGRTTVVIRDLRTYYTLYCVYVITSGCTQGAAAEEDSWGTAAEVDAVRVQFDLTTRD